MTATITDSLEALDYDYEPPCEHSQHEDRPEQHDDGPARWYKRPFTGPCGCHIEGVYVCNKWRELVSAGKVPLRCNYCGHVASREECAAIRFDPITNAA